MSFTRLLFSTCVLIAPLYLLGQRFTDFQVHDQDNQLTNDSYSNAIHAGAFSPPVLVGNYFFSSTDDDALIRYGLANSISGDVQYGGPLDEDLLAVTETTDYIVSVGKRDFSSGSRGILLADQNGAALPTGFVNVFDFASLGYDNAVFSAVTVLSGNTVVLGGSGCFEGEERGFVGIISPPYSNGSAFNDNIFVAGQRLASVDHLLVEEDGSILAFGQVYQENFCGLGPVNKQSDGGKVAVQRFTSGLSELNGPANEIILPSNGFDRILDAEFADNGNICILGFSESGLGPNNINTLSEYPYWLYCTNGPSLNNGTAARATGFDDFEFVAPVAITGRCDAPGGLNVIGSRSLNISFFFPNQGPRIWTYDEGAEEVNELVAVGNPNNYDFNATAVSSVHRDTATGLIYIGANHTIPGEFGTAISTDMAYVVYDSEVCQPCVPDKDYNISSFNGLGIAYAFTGSNAADLEYRFYPNTTTRYAGGEIPWIVNNETIFGSGSTSSQPFLDVDLNGFDGQTVEICYPVYLLELNKTANNCDYEYRCDFFCIEEEPDDLEGLITCPICNCIDDDAQWLPDPFACESFASNSNPEPLPLDISSRWLNGTTPVDLRGINRLSIPTSPTVDYRYQLFTGTGSLGISGRLRVSFLIDAIDEVNEAGYQVLNAGGTELFTVNTNATTFTVSMGDIFYNWPKASNPTFEVAMIFDDDRHTVEFWSDRSFLGTIPIGSASDPAALRFSNFIANDFSVDQICVRTPSGGFCGGGGDPVCTDSGQEYANACVAERQGLYAPGEYENCFTICDKGGPLISRLFTDQVIAGTTFNNEIAPPHIYTDPCVVDFYDAEVPAQLYADVFLFENNDQTDLEFVTDLAGCGNPTLFIYSCESLEGGGYGPVCLTPDVFGLYTLLPFENYYFVVLTEVPQDYCFTFFPTNQDCTIEENGAFVVQNDEEVFTFPGACDTIISIQSNFAGAQNNFQRNASSQEDINEFGSCYDGFREYTLGDKVYSLDLPYPAYLSLDLNIDNADGIAGVFIYRNICGTECMTYFDTRIFETSARLDSVRVPAGNYYFVIDQERPVDGFTLDICVRKDLENNITGIVGTQNFDVDECQGEIGDTIQHDFAVVIPPGFSPAQQNVLSVWYENDVGLPGSYPQGSQLINGQLITFNLPQQPNPGPVDNSRCGFEPDDRIRLGISTNDGNLLSLIPTAFVAEDNRDTFIRGGESRVLNYEVDTSYYLALQLGQLVLNTAGRAVSGGNTISIATNINFRVESDADWLTFNSNGVLGQTANYPRDATSIPFTATALVDGQDRTTTFRVIAGANDEIRQEFDVIQRGACQEATLSVTPRTTGCTGELVTVDLSTGNIPLIAYEYFLNGQPVTLPLTIEATAGSQTYELTARDRVCNEEAQQTFIVEGVSEPTLTETEKICTPDLSAYQVEFITEGVVGPYTGQGTLAALGNNRYRISAIPADTAISVTLTRSGCTAPVVIEAPICACPTDNIGLPSATETTVYVCPDENAQLEVAASNNSVVWFNASGAEVARGQNTYTATQTGAYFAAFAYANGTNCVSEDRLRFEVRTYPTLNPTFTVVEEGPLCAGNTLRLTAAVQNPDGLAISYTWNGNNGAATEDFTLSAGENTIVLRAQYAGANCGEEARFVYTVTSPPDIQMVSDFPACGQSESVYTAAFRTSADSVWVNVGQLAFLANAPEPYYEVTEIPNGIELVISAANRSGMAVGISPSMSCVATERIAPIDCSCAGPTPAAEILNLAGETVYYCADENRPVIRIASHTYTTAWYAEDGSLLASGTDAFTPPADGNYSVQLLVDGRPACSSLPRTFTVAQLAAISLTPPPVDTFCQGDPITLIAAGSWTEGLPLTYRWGGAQGTMMNVIPDAPPGSGSTTLEVAYAAYGCRASIPYEWYVVAKPDIVISPGQPACGSDEDFYAVTFTVSADTVFTTLNIGTLSALPGTPNGYRIENIPVGQTVEINAYNNFGRASACFAQETSVLNDCNCPSNGIMIPFANQERYFCADEAPEAVNLPALAEGFAYVVTAPNGFQTTLSSLTLTPTQAGAYQIAIAAEDRGCVGSASRTIEWVALPAITLTPIAPVTVCGETEYTITPEVSAGAGPDLEFSWPDGSEADNYSLIVAAGTSVEVPYSVSYADVGCTVSGSVTVAAPAAATVTVDPDFEGCRNDDPTLFDWAFTSTADEVVALQPDLGPLSSNEGQYFVPGISATQGLRLRLITTLNGLSCSTDTLLLVEEPCACNSNGVNYNLATTEYTTCPEAPFGRITLPNPGEGFALTVVTPDGTVANLGGLTFTPVDTGQYEVFVRNAESNCVATTGVSFRASYLTPPTPVIDAATVACSNAQLTLSANQSEGEGSLSYAWTTSFPIADGGAATTTGTPSQIGITTVSLTVTDGNGCSATIDQPIDVQAAPEFNLVQEGEIICHNDRTALLRVEQLAGPSIMTYAWSTGNNGSTVATLPAGDYGVTVTSTAGCVDSARITVVQPDPLGLQDTIITPDRFTGGLGAIVAIPGGGTPPYTYTWYDGSTELDSTSNSITMQTSDADLQIEITDANGCTFRSGGIEIPFLVSNRTTFADLGVRIYPNPVGQLLTIDFTQATRLAETLEIRAIDGRLIKRISMNDRSGSRWQVDLGHLAPGSYSLHLRAGARTFHQLIIKQ